MSENLTPQNASGKTAYVLTNKGVITLNADNMTQEDFNAISKQLSQIMADIQSGKTSDVSQSSPTPVQSDNNFSFTSSAPVKQKTEDTEKIASPTAFNLFDDDDDDVDVTVDDAAKEEQTRLQNAAPVLHLSQNEENISNVDARKLYDSGIVFAEKSTDYLNGGKSDVSIDNAEIKTTKNASCSTGSSEQILNDDTEDNIKELATTTEDTIPDDDDDDGIEDYIKSTGYIDNANLWRRWIMAQMLRHYNKADGTSGFDEYFVTGTPYYYQWKTALSELKVLRHLRGDALTSRERFFNAEVIKEMAKDYQKKIATYISKSKKRRDKNFAHVPPTDHRRCMYVTIPGYYKRIYLDSNPINPGKKYITLDDFMAMVNKYVNRICNCPNTHYHNLYQNVEAFMKACPIERTFAKSSAWKNAFKGSGAYYTMDNMIKFHDCRFHLEDGRILSMEDSLKLLEAKTAEYRTEYYRLYALMRQFVSDNNFTYDSIPVDSYHLPKYDG